MTTAGALSKKPTIKKPARSVVEKFRSEFCPQLMNRVHPLIEWIAGIENPYLIFINLVDRSNSTSLNNGELVYAGMEAQKKLLKRNFGLEFPNLVHTKTQEPALWEYLDQTSLPKNDALASSANEKLIEENAPVLENISVLRLKEDYLLSYLDGGDFSSISQSYEFPILNFMFNVEEDCFITLPLVQFGKFDGSIHIVFKKEDSKPFEKKQILKHLIRQFSLEYESLLLDWDLVGDNAEKRSKVEADLRYLASDEFQEECKKVQILKELGYDRYYKNSERYFLERVRQNDTVPNRFKNEHRKRAIIAILIDSYAHNISAHSLTVIKWWFQQRAAGTNFKNAQEIVEKLKKEDRFVEWGCSLEEYIKENYPSAWTGQDVQEGIYRVLARWIGLIENRENNPNADYIPARDQLGSLSEQLHPLFKFLLEKGAFWSGVTRDQQFGGEIRDLYSILWDDFINNPLYLGTIAYSEKIKRLNLRIRVYSEESLDRTGVDPFEGKYKIAKNTKDQYLDGTLAYVNVGNDLERQGDDISHIFVHKGQEHTQLKEVLETCKVFLPGGVVGKHAFFTLMENEIRNVKHFPEKDLEEMQRDGLTLCISIRLSRLNRQLHSDAQSIYKIGIWLNHKVNLLKANEHLVIRRLEGLMEDIITDETNEARLGGSFQDKICAAMLFNGYFSSVHNGSAEPLPDEVRTRDHFYYPWLRAAFNVEDPDYDTGEEIEFEVRADNLDYAKAVLQERQLGSSGYIKKYVHLWRGEEVYHMDESDNLAAENLARFQLLTYEKETDASKKRIQDAGVIRHVAGLSAGTDYLSAQRAWLNKWLKEDTTKVSLRRGDSAIGHLIFNEGSVQYLSPTEWKNLPKADKRDYVQGNDRSLKFVHADSAEEADNNYEFSKYLSIRSHGILSKRYFPDVQSVGDFQGATIVADRIPELVEVLETKISIFDKRVFDRIKQDAHRKRLQEQLLLGIYDEQLDLWNSFDTDQWKENHFIIVHLSFIETMINPKTGKAYGEAGIVDFIENHLKDALSDNCLLVITTGRGRTQWWKTIQQSKYARYVTFRPVESLIEAVEKPSLKRDDTEIKYNMTKVLFGS